MNSMAETRLSRQVEAVREERVKRRVESLRQAYFSKGQTVESAFRDTGLRQLPTASGEVRSVVGQEERKPVLVNTDEGVVVEADREIVTEEMWNCLTIVIVGSKVKEMAHLTPGGYLPYREYQFPDGRTYSDPRASVERMVQPLRELGESLDQYQILIIFNRASASADPNKFNYPHQEAAMKNLVELFESAGLSKVRVVETALTETLTYHTPERSKEVFVVGKRAMYDERGEIITPDGEVGAAWIPMEGSKKFEFLERPAGIVPGQADSVIDV